VLSDEEFVAGFADAVLEGRPVDWDAVHSSATASQRALIAHLRSIAAISSFMTRSAAEHDEALPLTADTAVARADTLAGSTDSTWGHLQLIEVIGRGAFGTVYRARDPRLHRDVALKLLRADRRHDAALAEGRLLARIRHPNVVTIYGADRIADTVGFWMELVEGETVDEIVSRDGPLSSERVVSIAHHLCEALAAVHGAGLVHRDVKAHNVMIEPGGRVVLMDFGTGRPAEDSGSSIAGTPLYLAPEVFAGAVPSARSDQYSLAVLLFFALTGRYPTSGESIAAIREAHATDAVDRNVRALRPDTPRPIAQAIAKALARDPGDRFASLDAMTAALAPRRLFASWAAVAVALTLSVTIGVVVLTVPAARSMSQSSVGPSAPAGNQAAGGGPSNRRLELPPGSLFGNGMSYDGRIYAFASIDGAPAVYHLDTGHNEILAAPSQNGYTERVIASPDGSAIAYQWWPTAAPCELRVVSLDGEVDRVLLREERGRFPEPMEWSRDGSLLVVMLNASDGGRRLVLVDAASGALKFSYEIRSGTPGTVRLSPDNRYIALDLPDDAEPRHWSIRIINVATGDERVLLPGERTDNRFGLWTPDGDHLFFLSDRAGTPDGWTVPISDGTATGEPTLTAQNLARISSLGMVSSGAFYYRLQSGQFDVQEVAFDAASLASTSRPGTIRTSTLGSNIGPSYSHDGGRLAFIAERSDLGGDLGKRVVVVRNRRTGEERELTPPLSVGLLSPAWSHDDRQLLIRGTNRQNQWGVFAIDASTGRVQHEIHWPERDMTEYGRAVWAADDQAVLFEHSGRGIVRHRLDISLEETVFSYARYPSLGRASFFEYSPDGSTLALSVPANRGNPPRLLMILTNGEVRVVATPPNGLKLAFQGWLPGGQYLLYSTFGTPATGRNELWRVAAAGGPPQQLGLAVDGLTAVNRVAIDPSGNALAFTTGVRTNTIWMMEHFLGGSR
jgi:Tol biopolymer transport system component/tRNA A-37 threonylcarbamoyl transferase component Bud32